MSKLYIINGKSIRRKAIRLGLASLLGTGLFFTGSKYLKYNEKVTLDRNAKVIEAFIHNNDFVKARSLIQVYHKNNHLRPEDEEKIVADLIGGEKEYELKVKRGEGFKRFEETLNPQRFSEATNVLQSLKGSQLYSDAEITAFEKRIDFYTEEGFLRNLKSLTNGFVNLLEQYVSWYPRGTNRSAFLKGAISEIIQSATNNLNPNVEFTDNINRLSNLNAILEKHGKTLSLEAITKLGLTSQFIERARVYGAAREQYDFLTANLKVGDNVIVRSVDRSRVSIGFNSDYYNERIKNFPIGTKGEIVNFNGENVIVKFNVEPKLIRWGREWSEVEKYGQFTAVYKDIELVRIKVDGTASSKHTEDFNSVVETLERNLKNISN